MTCGPKYQNKYRNKNKYFKFWQKKQPIFAPEAYLGLVMLTNWLRRTGCPYDRASTYYMMIEA